MAAPHGIGGRRAPRTAADRLGLAAAHAKRIVVYFAANGQLTVKK
jgi:hypothetical protein